jgi:GT2 family glycosyltransferase
MLRDRTIFDEPHHQSLELLAVEALGRGDAVRAFKLADRRCRILPPPEPHSHIIRADASYQMGDQAAALSDIANALLLDPENLAANRRMLAWGEGAKQKRAAFALIRHDGNTGSLRLAIEVLRRNGQHAFAHVTVFNDLIEGWAVWETEAPLEITISDGIDHVTTVVESDPTHPFGDILRAANFRLIRPKSSKPQLILLSTARRAFYSIYGVSNGRAPKERRELHDLTAPNRRVTVVVPVYGDYEATRVCLDSLLNAMRGADGHHVMLVDDASPDWRVRKYLAKIAKQPHVELLTNERNLGFVGAVNRALEHVGNGDIILLNSDTVVPVGFVDRLTAAARSSPDIGTVTPLSNNGDLAGFPVRNSASPLEPLEVIEQLNRIATDVNAGRVVDIPNGVGFCLYITRECLDAVGRLSEELHRGYLEDADFCLRAREHGFRNVCAPSVYVGHAGSKSFGAEKRSLVVRNLAVLERRFPKYRFEYGGYSLLDPLRPYRAAIELHAPPPLNHPGLLVTGAGIVGAIARARAYELARRGQPVVIMEVRQGVAGPVLNIANAAGGMPQSIQFALYEAAERTSLLDYLQKLRPSRIEILDPARVPLALVDLLLDLRVACELFIADAGLFGGEGEPFGLSAVRSTGCYPLSAMNGVPSSGDRCADLGASRSWLDIAAAAERILVPCEHARALAVNFLPQWRNWRLEPSGTQLFRRVKRPRKPNNARLGLLPLRGCAEEHCLIGEIACAFRIIRPDVSLTVLGTTFDDVGLMRVGNIFVTGAMDAWEFPRIVKAHGLQSLFVSVSRPVFGHPILLRCLRSSLPVAFFDWSLGHIRPSRGDLPLDPRSSLSDIVAALDHWLRIP